MSKETGRFLLLILLFCITSFLNAKDGLRNQGLLKSSENLAANLVLTGIPLGLVGGQDEVIIKWKPSAKGIFRYAAIPGGADPARYPSTLAAADLIVNSEGEIRFKGEKLPAGIYYCVITDDSEHSTEFVLIREASVSPRMINPRSARGETGISTNSPVFTWEEVNGVPFYHIILSDQSFTVSEDEDGNTQTEGANIIWQAITSGNSIAYGAADPSGSFTVTTPPPLVKGVRYNWIVANNYANNPALSSSVTSGPAGFEVEVTPPFESPVNLQPTPKDIIASDVITFRWNSVEGASLYHIYLARFEDLRGSKVLWPVWDGVTSNNLLDLPGSILQQEGTYYWKVLAQDKSGNGAMGDTTSFFYSAKSAQVNFRTTNIEGKQLPRSKLTLESLTHGSNPMLVPTDDSGVIERSLPLGAYKVTATKEGYEDSTVVFEIHTEGVSVDVLISLEESPSNIYGSTRGAGGNPLGYVQIHMTAQNSGEIKETTSDINGKFSLALSSDTWQVSATKPGYKSAAGRPVFLEAGVELNLDDAVNGGPLILSKNVFHLNGLVTTPDGEAIWRATIVAVQGEEREQAFSDAQGRYELTLGAGDWDVSVVKDGYVSPAPQKISIIDHNVSLNWVVTPQANIISGTVISDGRPLENAEVLAIPNSGQVVKAITDVYGQYVLSLGRGTYQIVPEKKGYISPKATQFALSVGQTISGIKFVLVPENSYITGEVTIDGVTPLAGVTITNGAQTTTTGSNGRYTLGVLYGTYTISASKQGYLASETKEVSLTPGQTLSGINFLLTPNASVITGTIKNGSLPVNGAEITARNNNNVYRTASDHNGRYSLSINAGTYIITAEKTGFVPTSESIMVTVNPGQTAPDKNFNFVENLSYIAGIVRNAATPLRNAAIQIQALGAAHSFSTITGVDGKFNLSVLPGFAYTVQAVKLGYNAHTDTTALLKLGETNTRVFELTAHQSLVSGKVADAGGGVLANATIRAASATASFTTLSDPLGKYKLGVDAGVYNLTIQKSGYIPFEKELTISVGDTIVNPDVSLVPNYASLDGFITNTVSGKGIEKSLVVVTESGGLDGGSSYTDAQGHYVIQNLPIGVYKVTITHPAFIKKTIENQVLAGGVSRRLHVELTPKDGRIEGLVSTGGAGIAGVTVTAVAPGISISAVTDGDGSYQIRNLKPEKFTVQASLNGYTSSSAMAVDVKADGISKANFTVTPNEGRITGFVKENGIGLAGARVVAAGASDNTGFAVSRADGSYTIANLAADNYKLYVQLDRYISSPDTVNVPLTPGETVTTDFSLSKSVVRIAGKVQDQIGKGLADVEVVAESPKGIQKTTSNGNGEFALDNLPTDARYVIKTNIFEEGFKNGDSVLVVNNADISGIVLPVEIFRSKIRGNVGVASATVTAENLRNKQIYTINSQSDGSYLFKNLYNGDYNVSVNKLGYQSNPSLKSVTGLGVSEERSKVDFVLTEIKITISGFIKDADGSPLANVPVLAWSAEASGRDTTDEKGFYSISNLPPNVKYTLQTKLPQADYDNASLSVEVGETDSGEQNLVISVHNGIIQGKISSTAGDPVSGALISIVELDSVTTTDSQGSYRFQHLASGTYTLKIRKEGFESVAPATIKLAQGETKVYDSKALTFLTSAIFGVISNQEERLENVLIKIIDQSTGGVVRQDTTNSGGIYSVNDLQVGKTYTVVASHKGYLSASKQNMTLEAGTATADFVLLPIVNSIYGKVFNKADNHESAGALVKINGIAGGIWRDSTDAFGSFSVSGLTRGTYSIVAEKDGLISASQTINLITGAAAKADLLLEQPATISGSIRYLGDGRPGVTMNAVNSLAGTVTSTISDANGQFIINGLSGGTYTVSCNVPGFSVDNSPQILAITSGSLKTVHFTLTAQNNSIIGTVTDEDANLLGGAIVRIWNESIKDSTVSELNGQFQFMNLSDGTYQIQARLSGFLSPESKTVNLIGGKSVIEDLQLIAIKNSISGFVKDGATAKALAGAIVTAQHRAGSTVTDTTGSDGSYFFELKQAGEYQLKVQKGGYKEAAGVAITLFAGEAVVRNLILTPSFTLRSISGTITRRGAAVAAARVICTPLANPGERDTVFADASGKYRFNNLIAPGDYLLEVHKDKLPVLTSPILKLTEAGLFYNFLFPSGQLKWRITRDGNILLPGVSVKITAGSQNIGLITDNNGEGQTEANLSRGEYLVAVEKDPHTIPPSRYAIKLPDDTTTVLENMYLPFIHTAQASVSLKDSLKITVQSLVTPQDTLWLYYKGVDAPSFSRIPLTPEAIESDTADYAASIPPQGNVGQLNYFIKTEFRKHVYSNERTPFKTEVTREGILSKVNVNFERKKVSSGVPVFLQVRAYDGVNQALIPEQVRWRITSGAGNFLKFSSDSTKAWFKSDVDTTTHIEVQVRLDGVVLAATVEVITQTKKLGNLIINSSILEASSRETVRFTYSAVDTGGVFMSVYPIWDYFPKNSGTLTVSDEGESAVFKAAPDYFGQVQISLRDSLSGRLASFNSNADMNTGDAGLKIYQVISEGNPELEITDGEGFYLLIPANVVEPGVNLKVKLNKPQIPDVKRFTRQYQVVGKLYDINVAGQFKAGKSFVLKFPIADMDKNKTLRIGHWNINSLNWIPQQGTREGSQLVTRTSHFSEFAVLESKQALGISELRLLPNPFTAHDPYGMQISFSLSSNDVRKPWVTVKVYNLRGDLVRTICENKPMAPITYQPGGRETLFWDGRTDNGKLARNGRYLVIMNLKDNTGEKTEMQTVVLIK